MSSDDSFEPEPSVADSDGDSSRSGSASRFALAISAIDAANSEDPTRQPAAAGGDEPAALAYARRMSEWLDRLSPDASEPLKLAARAQHIRRWTRPRHQYPQTRAGYHRWRTALYQFHADEAAAILSRVGYDQPFIDRVSSLLKKQNIKSDPEAQMLEDVICLVFLENYFGDFATQHDDAKLIGILQKTWKKMSPVGHAHALKLPLTDRARALVARALKPAP